MTTGAAGSLAAVTNIDCVKALHERAVLFRPRDEVQRLRRQIDRRRSGDPDVACEVHVRPTGLPDVGARHGNDAGRRIRVVDTPERS